jgi:argininosuccinate lyase
MKTRDDINKICEALARLIGIIIERAKENKDVPMPLYTHLQQAQIGTFSHLMLSYCYALMRDMERLYQSYGRINQSPLGASAIGGSSINIDRKRTAALLGFDSVIMNSIDATSTRDAFLEYAATLSILMTTLGRIAEDFIIWSTVEFGFIELADRYSSTSSAMPQKKNPDPLELIRAKVAITTGNFVTLLGIVKSIPSGYSRDLQEFKPPLLNSSTTVLASLKLMEGVTKTLVINSKKMRESANRSYAVALDVAEQLVSRCNLTFRNAHRVVGALVQRAVEMNNTPLMLLKPADVESAVQPLELGVKTEILVGIIKELTPNKSLELRKTLGSPSPTEHDEMIRSLSQGLSNYSTGITKRTRLVKETFDALYRLVQQYLQT